MRPRESLLARIGGYATGAAASIKRRQARQQPRIRAGWDDGAVELVDWRSTDGEAMVAEAEELIRLLDGEDDDAVDARPGGAED